MENNRNKYERALEILSILFLLFLITCSILFEIPKIFYLMFDMLEDAPYRIIPQFHGPISNSMKIWILFHLITSLILFYGTIYLYVVPLSTLEYRDDIKRIHYLFLVSVIINFWNLGPLDTYYSMLVNITLIYLLQLCFIGWNSKRYVYVYIMILSLPMAFDVIACSIYMKISMEMIISIICLISIGEFYLIG